MGIFFSFFARGSSDQGRYKVLEMDTKGNLYLYKSALLCKNEIIKRLTRGNYQLAEPSTLGINFSNFTYKHTNSTLAYLALVAGTQGAGKVGRGGRCVLTTLSFIHPSPACLTSISGLLVISLSITTSLHMY